MFCGKNSFYKSEGFTIIELIVVIAIIAVLASIVLVNVISYIPQSKNGAIKGNVNTLLTNSIVWFDSNADYRTFQTSDTYRNPRTAINNIGGNLVFTATISAICFCSPLNVTIIDPVDSTYCVDTTGYKKVTQNSFHCFRCSAGRCTD